jgi:cytochrome c oxidase subunit 2
MTTDWRNFLSALPVAVLVFASAGCGDDPSEASLRAERGEELYGYCVQCHGTAGQGNLDFRAPAIAGLERWYIERQLEKFRIGARGDHPADLDGLRMRPMSRVLASDEEVGIVAEYVANLPTIESDPVVQGDPARGRSLFEPCVQCHGEQAEGNREMNAPRLTDLNDWYMVAQLEKFRAGVRGSDPLDATGAQMRPMASTLPDDTAVRDVVAYIRSL